MSSTVLRLYCPGVRTLSLANTTPRSPAPVLEIAALYNMTSSACCGFVTRLEAFVSVSPFDAVLTRNDSGALRRSPTQKGRAPVNPKHVSWAAMLTMNHAAESAADSRDSQVSTAPDPPISIKTPASARRALEEAREVVRKKRQQAKDRRASEVDLATITSIDPDTTTTTTTTTTATTTTVVRGTEATSNEAARGYEGNYASKGRALRTYDGGRGRGRGRGQWPRGVGRGGRGVIRGRVLPDFTEIDALGPREDNNANRSGEVVELPDKEDASALALVAAIRATLVSTAAQVEERRSRAVIAVAEDRGGGYDLSQDEFAPQGWLRTIGLIRRACAEVKIVVDEDRSSPPRIAFELALQVCVLCSRPDAGLEVLSLMRSTGLEPALEAYKVVMDSYSVKRRQGRALFTLQTMMAVREAGIVPDLEMLSAATEACSRARDREGALHFMDQAFRLGLNPNERMYREAIIAYSQTGKWLEARDLALRWRDQAFSPSAAATAVDIATGADAEGESMPFLPPAICNTAILKAMGKAGRVDEALSWLGDIVSSAASIASEAKSHHRDYDGDEGEGMGDARPRSPRRNEVLISGFVDQSSFLAVLSACSRTGRWESSVEVLRMMEEDAGIAPEAAAFNTALAAFEHRSRTLPSMTVSKEEGGEPFRGSQRWRVALELLSKMEERELAPDVVAYNRVINVLRWAGQRQRALEVLEGMNRRSAEGLSRVRPDVITYNSAIAACAAGSDSKWKKAVQLLNEMRRKDLKPDRYSYTSAIHACAKAENPVDALRLLRAMEANEVRPDVIAMTACIDALASGGRLSEAVGLLDEMRTKGIAPNERTYQAAIQACGKGGQWQRALELLALLEARPSGATVQEYNCAMMACVAGGESMRALDMLERIKRSKGGINSGPDVLTYTSAITACAAEGMWKTALDLLEEMRRVGPRAQPNVKSYTAAIAACGRAGEWRQALELHSRLSEEGLAPDAASFNAVISAARRGGQHDLAMELLASMLRADLSPDDITVAELVTSLSDRGKWGDAIQALEIAARTGAIPASSLDGEFEVDVSHLPSAIAKVKVRATLQRILGVWRENNSDPASLKELIFVTGTGNVARTASAVGRAEYGDDYDNTTRESRGLVQASRHSPASEGEGKREGWRAPRYSDRSFSLGKMLAEDLRTAYSPPLQAQAQSGMAGCLVVGAQDLVKWASAQSHWEDTHVNTRT